MTFKDELYSICENVALEFPSWAFANAQFQNKSLKHTNLIIGLGSYIQRGADTAIQPGVAIDNKSFSKLWRFLLGYHSYTSIIQFQTLANELVYTPKQLRRSWSIWKNRNARLAASTLADNVKEHIIDINDAKPDLRAVLMDGIAIFDKYYDLSSEEALLYHLPPNYEPYLGDNLEFEMNAGVRMCVIRILQVTLIL